MYFVESGKVSVLKKSADGEEKIVSIRYLNMVFSSFICDVHSNQVYVYLTKAHWASSSYATGFMWFPKRLKL
jgi:hypothetical protein